MDGSREAVALVKELVMLPKLLGLPENEEIKDYAAEAVLMPLLPERG